SSTPQERRAWSRAEREGRGGTDPTSGRRRRPPVSGPNLENRLQSPKRRRRGKPYPETGAGHQIRAGRGAVSKSEGGIATAQGVGRHRQLGICISIESALGGAMLGDTPDYAAMAT